MRILCLGDSLTYGFALPRGQVWTARCAARTGSELINRSLNGNTTGGMLASISQELKACAPDAVMLMGGFNDLIYGGDLPGAKANMGAMLHIAAHAGVLPIVGIGTPVCPPIPGDWAAWIDPVLADGTLEGYGRWLRELGRMFRLPLLDFRAEFPKQIKARGGALPDYYLEDRIHPNGAGHALMADIAAETISALARRHRRPQP